MLDLKVITQDSEQIKNKLESRGFDSSLIDKVVELSKVRSEEMTKLQSLESERNKISKEIGILKKNGESADHIFARVKEIKEEIETLKVTEQKVNADIREILMGIPNIPNSETPYGKDEDENVPIADHILGRGLVEGVKAHFDIATDLDIVDFERAVKLAGTRFWAYKGLGSRLVRALENFMLDEHVSRGYTEFRPPVVAKRNILEGTGQLPKFEDDLFKLEGTDSFLIPTAEVPLTNMYAGEIVDLSTPMTFTAFTLCFRAEAGSAGRDTRGLIRAHQFNKVEIVKLVTAEQKEEEFNKSLADAKNILEKLELPFRELRLVTGDIGFSAEQTIDLEVWLPSEGKFREISSVSSFGDFQARRAMIRYKDGKSTNYAHTINGSGLAIDRTVAAILENYQNEDGSITVPKVLVPYMNGIEIIK